MQIRFERVNSENYVPDGYLKEYFELSQLETSEQLNSKKSKITDNANVIISGLKKTFNNNNNTYPDVSKFINTLEIDAIYEDDNVERKLQLLIDKYSSSDLSNLGELLNYIQQLRSIAVSLEIAGEINPEFKSIQGVSLSFLQGALSIYLYGENDIEDYPQDLLVNGLSEENRQYFNSKITNKKVCEAHIKNLEIVLDQRYEDCCRAFFTNDNSNQEINITDLLPKSTISVTPEEINSKKNGQRDSEFGNFSTTSTETLVFPDLKQSTQSTTSRSPASDPSFEIKVYNSSIFQSKWLQLFLLALIISTALVAITLAWDPVFLPKVISEVIAGLSKLSVDLIFGAAVVVGAGATVTLAASLYTRFFAEPDLVKPITGCDLKCV